MSQKINVRSVRPYSLFLGESLETLGAYLRQSTQTEHLLIITQPYIGKLYLERLCHGLSGFRYDVLYVPEGEEEKSLERLSTLTSQAVACGADRHSMVLALGGGVIGDLAGFWASMFMRGIPFVQIPTTLLAQVDSSIGGKVAVNHPAGKNLLGAFYPPFAVWMDFSTLQTLPWQEVQNGLAETIKHAVIADGDLFAFLEKYRQQILDRSPEVYEQLTTRSLHVKVKIVESDEKEQGQRMLLNYGHSFGHALEVESLYHGISHGQGVSIGMVAAAYLAEERGLMNHEDVTRLIHVLESFGLPVRIENKDPHILLRHMETDKKNKNGQKILILPQGIGKASVIRDVQDEEIIRVWEKVILHS